MREKYLEEKYPKWFIFGYSPDKTLCDINDGVNDIACGVPVAIAKSVIRRHNLAQEALLRANDLINRDEDMDHAFYSDVILEDVTDHKHYYDED